MSAPRSLQSKILRMIARASYLVCELARIAYRKVLLRESVSCISVHICDFDICVKCESYVWDTRATCYILFIKWSRLSRYSVITYSLVFIYSVYIYIAHIVSEIVMGRKTQSTKVKTLTGWRASRRRGWWKRWVKLFQSAYWGIIIFSYFYFI